MVSSHFDSDSLLVQNPLAVHFGLLKASDMILVDYFGVPIGGQ